MSGAEAVIYLASQRGCNQNDWFRSYYTFNFGQFKRESRAPFGSLMAVNEHTLKEGRTLSLTAGDNINVLLLPIEGELSYKSGIEEGVVDVGQVCCITQSRETIVEISNCYTSRPINFLQICIGPHGKNVQGNLHHISSFDIESDNGQLIPLLDPSVSIFPDGELFSIGKLGGRHEVVYQKKGPNNGLFVYEIAGTCEVHKRLLLPGDALSIKNEGSIELEALTHEAIFLIAEIPLTTLR